jgi:hypothetical protein
MEPDPVLLKASLAFAGLLVAAAYLPADLTPSQNAPVLASRSIDVALRDYNAVRQDGNPLERCTKARAVALAYLRAEDRAGFQTWEQVGSQNCAAAGFHTEGEALVQRPTPGLATTATRASVEGRGPGGT